MVELRPHSPKGRFYYYVSFVFICLAQLWHNYENVGGVYLDAVFDSTSGQFFCPHSLRVCVRPPPPAALRGWSPPSPPPAAQPAAVPRAWRRRSGGTR